ncbi:G domain-containing protein [Planctomycetales bacterium 10988]|nr:G domain-containing protein [Planctomycetales bacterium 10988]
MPINRNFWDKLWENIVSPKLDEEELNEHLQEIRQKLPVPVFWLLGKTQSGKTSIVRGLTGSTEAEVGNGFRPCTKTSRLYPFPDEEKPFLQFLDTRGIGEVDYDPSEDMQQFQNRAHLIMVVVKALDHAQQSVVEPLRAIVKKNPSWPIIIVQTCLHEGYPDPTQEHPEPDPFGDTDSKAIPDNLRRSLQKQRELFEEFEARFVPVDFTLPEDGYAKTFYGLDRLWETIEGVLPLGLRAILEQPEIRSPYDELIRETAEPHIIAYAIAAGGAGAWPIPFVGTPLFLAIQAKMFHSIASLYNQEVSKELITEMSSALGVSFLFRLGGRELLKFVPGFGSAVSALYSAATTYALGKTLCYYFAYMQKGMRPDSALFRQIMEEQYKEGREKLGEYLKHSKSKKAGEVQPQEKTSR